MPDIDQLQEFLADEHGLVVISTTQADGRVLPSVVNCGVTNRPLTGARTVAFVAGGNAVRRDWKWIAATDPATILGPSELTDRIDANDLRLLLRNVLVAAGGGHDDFDEFDRVMADDTQVAIFLSPNRLLGSD